MHWVVLPATIRHEHSAVKEVHLQCTVRMDVADQPHLSIQHHVGVRAGDVATPSGVVVILPVLEPVLPLPHVIGVGRAYDLITYPHEHWCVGLLYLLRYPVLD